jgi:tRNA G18 (ribose-2'-O)-methylase SpoU
VDWSTALADPAALRAAGLFLAEGRLVLSRVLAGAAGGHDAIVAVLSTPAAARALGLEQHLADRLTIRAPAEMEALTGFNFHRGVLALVRRPPVLDVANVIAAATVRMWGGVFVVAEHLVDVDNVGSCFRNARAFGAAGVLLDERCPDPLYRKAVRTSLGHVLEVPWAQATIREILSALRARGVVTVGLTPHERRTSNVERRAAPLATLAEARPRLPAHLPIAVVVGNEGSGLSPETLEACTHLACIPMAEGADSLNVATALAVALYELTRR